jgi:hypothetical protein
MRLLGTYSYKKRYPSNQRRKKFEEMEINL